MYKVLASCGAGIGSSLIIKQRIQKVFDDLGIEIELAHESLGTAKSMADQYDIIYTLAGLADNFTGIKNPEKVVGIKNIMSEDEILAGAKKVLGI